jgi:hypothetical protein
VIATKIAAVGEIVAVVAAEMAVVAETGKIVTSHVVGMTRAVNTAKAWNKSSQKTFRRWKMPRATTITL